MRLPYFLPAFLASTRQRAGVDMVLTLTIFVDDEKPLYVRLDALHRILQCGEAARGSGYVTSGFYYCAPRVSATCASLAPMHVGALQELLAWLQQDYELQGYLAPKMIDIDRPQDYCRSRAVVATVQFMDTINGRVLPEERLP